MIDVVVAMLTVVVFISRTALVVVATVVEAVALVTTQIYFDAT